jgi:hypothetical protein
MESATTNIGCKFIVADFLATDLSKFHCLQLATDNPMLTTSNGYSVAILATEIPLLILGISNG